jgi:hypothetical protein
VRRFLLPIAAILLTTACGSSAVHASSKPAHSSSRPPTKVSKVAPSPSKNHPSPAKPKPSPSKSKGCGAERDVIVWYKVPGVPDNSAQVIGNYNVVTCETTFHSVQTTSSTEAGYCTEAAWASDNPGYNADADRAARLKKVQVSVGPAC